MTDTAPDWATQIPNNASINARAPNLPEQLHELEQELDVLRAQLQNWVFQQFLLAVQGVFIEGESAITQLQAWVNSLGGDFEAVLADLGFVDPAGFVAWLRTINSWATLFGRVASGDLSAGVQLVQTLIPAGLLSVFQQIPAALLGTFGIGSASTTTPNLLPGGFLAAGTIDGQGIWEFDNTIGHGADKSVVAVPNGTDLILMSAAIPSDSSQTVNESVWVKQVGVTSSGTAFELRCQAYQADDTLLGAATVLDGTTPAAAIDWMELAGGYQPAPGTAYVRLVVAVTAAATNGQVWFSDPALTKTTQIPLTNISGLGLLPSLQETLQRTWDAMVAGFTQTPVTVASDISAVENAVGSLMTNVTNVGANPAVQAIVGQLNALAGAFPIHMNLGGGSSEATLPLYHLGSGSTPTNFAVTASAATIGFIRIGASSIKKVVEWHGAGIASITGAFISIYKMDITTGDLLNVYRSTDISSGMSAGWVWNQHVLTTPLPVVSGEVYGVELRVTGTGTHTIAGAIPTWMPDYPGYPKRGAATRGTGASPSSIPSASVVYSNNVPWFGFAMDPATLPTVDIAPQADQWLTPGVYTLNIQPWAVYLDVVGCSAGGGGGGGDNFGIPVWYSGYSGAGGSWVGETITRGVDIPWEVTQLQITVPAGGGAGGPTNGTPSLGGNGSSVVIAAVGYSWSVSVTGGVGGNAYVGVSSAGGTFGGSPGNFTLNGRTYYGGAGGEQADTFGGNGQWGTGPGGGGGGGNTGGSYPINGGWGGGGAGGAAYVTQRQS